MERTDVNRPTRWFACKEHAEWVLDDLVEEFKSAPSMDTVSPPGSARCRMCGRAADRVFFFEFEEDSTGAPGDSGGR